ncbi:Protein of unknown function DUF1644, partial [Dillenia turbinata]
MTDIKGSASTITDIRALHKELDEALCPICMDHPHNAVLLLCSSHDKGCRSYICDTSYRHSNCLDRFKKLRVDPRNSPSQHSSALPNHSGHVSLGQLPLNATESESGLTVRNELAEQAVGDYDIQDAYMQIENQRSLTLRAGNTVAHQDANAFEESMSQDLIQELDLHLKCPMCRGVVHGWKIVQDVRQYLDLKRRNCSQESCPFSGNYRELRRHARRVHPMNRPSDVDPSRQRAWQRLEHQREYGDIVSAIRSSMPGAIVFGDYVIENGDSFPGEGENAGFGDGHSPWWTTFFLVRMISGGSPRRSVSHPRGTTRAWSRHRRTSGGFLSRRSHWGENYLGVRDVDEWNFARDMDDNFSPIPRRRRRITRSRHDEDPRGIFFISWCAEAKEDMDKLEVLYISNQEKCIQSAEKFSETPEMMGELNR